MLDKFGGFIFWQVVFLVGAYAYYERSPVAAMWFAAIIAYYYRRRIFYYVLGLIRRAWRKAMPRKASPSKRGVRHD